MSQVHTNIIPYFQLISTKETVTMEACEKLFLAFVGRWDEWIVPVLDHACRQTFREVLWCSM